MLYKGCFTGGNGLPLFVTVKKVSCKFLDLSAQETKTLTWRFQPQTTTPGETE